MANRERVQKLYDILEPDWDMDEIGGVEGFESWLENEDNRKFAQTEMGKKYDMDMDFDEFTSLLGYNKKASLLIATAKPDAARGVPERNVNVYDQERQGHAQSAQDQNRQNHVAGQVQNAMPQPVVAPQRTQNYVEQASQNPQTYYEQAMNPERPAYMNNDEAWQNQQQRQQQLNEQGAYDNEFNTFYEQNAKPVLDEINERQRQKWAQEYRERARYGDPYAGYSSNEKRDVAPDVASREVSEAVADKMTDFVLMRLGVDPAALNATEAESRPMSQEEVAAFDQKYGEEYERLASALQQKIYDEYVRKGMPRNTIEYVVGSMFHNSLIGTVRDIMLSKLNRSEAIRNQLINQGLAAYLPNTAEAAVAGAATMMVDAPAFMAGGIFGNLLTKGVASVGGSLLPKSVMKGLAMVNNNFFSWGGYGAASDYAGQVKENIYQGAEAEDENYFSNAFNNASMKTALKTGAEEGLKGVAIGAMGAGVQYATRNAGRTARIATDIGMVPLEAGAFVTMDVMGADEPMTAEEIMRDYGQQVMMIGILHGKGVLMSGGRQYTKDHYDEKGRLVEGAYTADGRVKRNVALDMFTDEDLTMLKKGRYGSMFAKAKNAKDMMAIVDEVRVGDYGYDRVMWEGIVEDDAYPYMLRAKMAAAHGKMIAMPRPTQSQIIDDSARGNGFWLTTYASDGKVVESKHFDTKAKAEKAAKAIHGQLDDHSMMELMDVASCADYTTNEVLNQLVNGDPVRGQRLNEAMMRMQDGTATAEDMQTISVVRGIIEDAKKNRRETVLSGAAAEVYKSVGIDPREALKKLPDNRTEEDKAAINIYKEKIGEHIAQEMSQSDDEFAVYMDTDSESGTVKTGVTADGRTVIVKGSGDALRIKDVETGEVKMVDAKEVKIVSEVTPADALEERRRIAEEQALAAGAEQPAADATGEVAEGEQPSTAVTEQVAVEPSAEAELEPGALAEAGRKVSFYPADADIDDDPVDGIYLGPDYANTGKHKVQRDGKEPESVYAENIVMPKAVEPAAEATGTVAGEQAVAGEPVAEAAGTVAEGAGTGLMMDAKGLPTMQNDPKDVAAHYMNGNGGMSAEESREIVDYMIKDRLDKWQKLQDKKPAFKGDMIRWQQEKAAWEQQVEQLRQEGQWWRGVQTEMAKIENAAAEEARRQADAIRAEEEARIAEERQKAIEETRRREQAQREFIEALEQKRKQAELEEQQAAAEMTADELAEQAVAEENAKRMNQEIGKRLEAVGREIDLDQPFDETMAAQVAFLSGKGGGMKITPESLRLELGSNFGRFGAEGKLGLVASKEKGGRTIAEIADGIADAAGTVDGQSRLDANVVRSELINCIMAGKMATMEALERRVGIGTERPEDRPEYWTEQKIAEYEDSQMDAAFGGAGWNEQPNTAVTENANETQQKIAEASAEVNVNPTEAQKEAGNYKKGHVKVDGMEISIEQPKGSVRKGMDAEGKEWESEMHNTYGYIRGTVGKDKDHIDIFLSDNPEEGNVYVVDQVNPKTGEFDEHKVMYGFGSLEEAREAYLSNYEEGWQGLGGITEVNKATFKVWLQSSKMKTKPFADYKLVTADNAKVEKNVLPDELKPLDEAPFSRGNEPGTENVTKEQKLATETVMTALEGAKIPVEIATPEMVDQLAGNEEMMGASNRKKKMANIAQALNGVQMDADQRKVYEAFVNETKGGKITVTDADGGTRTLDLRLGQENNAGVLHSIYRHAGTRSNYITSEDILSVPELFKNGSRTPGNRTNRYEYTKTDRNGNTVTLITEKDGTSEKFIDLYTNKTAPNPEPLLQGNHSQTHNAMRHATPGNSAISGANVANNNETANNNGRNSDVEGQNNGRNGENGTSGIQLRTKDGKVYGWAKDGKIYLTEAGLNPNTPVHEYSHLWAESVKRKNPKLWENIKGLMKGTDIWKEVLGDELYDQIHGDEDRMASEVLSRLSGRRGAERLNEMAREYLEQNPNASIDEKAAHLSVIARVKRAIQQVWDWVGKELFGIESFGSAEEVADRTLYDLMHGTDLKLDDTGEHNTEYQVVTDENTVMLNDENFAEAIYDMNSRYVRNINMAKQDALYMLTGKNAVESWEAVGSRDFDLYHIDPEEIIYKDGKLEVRGKDLLKEQWDAMKEPLEEQKAFFERMQERTDVAWIKADLKKMAYSVQNRMDRLRAYAEKAEAGKTGRWAADGTGGEVRNRDYESEVFYSNAQKAVEGIKQEKATAEQWLKMIQNGGGLKAGEDKWLGLSDWLKDKQAKGEKLTKQEILDYIRRNRIEIEEVNYSEYARYSEDDWRDRVNESDAFAMLRDELVEYDENENPYIDRKRFDQMAREIPGFREAFSIDYWGEDIDIDDPLAAAQYLKLKGSEKPIEEIRLNYTTEGLTNKKEIALTIPEIKPYNESDDIHFGDAGNGRAVAWVRFGDAESTTPFSAENFEAMVKAHEDAKAATAKYEQELYDKYGIERDDSMESFEKFVLAMTPEENAEWNRLSQMEEEAYKEANPTKREKVLVIDEIQSKRHQDGREHGYTPFSRHELAQMRKEAFDALYGYMDELREKYNISKYDNSFNKVSDEERAKLVELRDRYDQATEDLNDAVPDAPFEKNWSELAMKRMLRYAAENGYDKVAWTKGAQQAKRYDISGVVDKIRVYTDGHPAAGDEAAVKSVNFMINDSDKQLLVNRNGIIVNNTIIGNSQLQGKPLAEVFGKDIADEIMGKPAGNTTIELGGREIGGEGMKGFYDTMLPSFMNKYGKKWGVKVGEVELDDVEDAARTMWSVDVTPEMKESVMQGQPMFRRTWHGSGADFEEFDHKFMGSGEGSQVYGWGTYVSEVDGIAKSYADIATAKKQQSSSPIVKWKGHEIDFSDTNPLRMAFDLVEDSRTIAEARARAVRYKDMAEEPEMQQKWQGALDILKQSTKADFKRASVKGNRKLYEVEIPDDNGENYISWNEPLSARQRKTIADALYNECLKQEPEAFETENEKRMLRQQIEQEFADAELNGGKAYGNVIAFLGSGQKGASKLLSEAGFVGVKVPTNNLREGDKSRNNYVIFDEKNAKIVNKTVFNEGLRKKETLWEKSEPSATDTAPVNVATNSARKNGLADGNASNQSNVSERKGSEKMPDGKINRAEITETAEKTAGNLGKKIHVCQNADEIKDPEVRASVKKAEAEGRTPTRKGWFNTRTGEIEVYAPAAKDADDVKKTVLHETVGHYGLRELLSENEQEYQRAMTEMYRLLNAEQKKQVTDSMQKRGWDVATAMDEFLADVAMQEHVPGWWQKAKSIVKNLLRKVGIDVELSDGDLKYMLWASREALRNSREVVHEDGSKSRVYDRKRIDQRAADWAMRWHNDVLGLRSKWEAERNKDKGKVKNTDAREEQVKNRGWEAEEAREEERRRTHEKSEAFKAWFGDWEKDPENASKVVDAEGRPLVVYHGTQLMEWYFKDGHPYTRYTERFNTFNDGKGFFTSDREAAESFARGKQGLYETYLDIKKPYVIDCQGKDWDAIEGYENKDGYKRVSTDYIVNDIKNNHPEYDGVIFKNVMNENHGNVDRPIDDYVPFRAEQIKSAVDNNGEFSRGNKDIRFRDDEDPDDPTTPEGGGSTPPDGGRKRSLEEMLEYEARQFQDEYNQMKAEDDPRALAERVRAFIRNRMTPLAGKRMTMADINSLMRDVDFAITHKTKKGLERALNRAQALINQAEGLAEIEEMMNALNTRTTTVDKKGMVKGVLVDETANDVLNNIKMSYQQMLSTSYDDRMSEVRREMRALKEEYGITRQDDPTAPEEFHTRLNELKQKLNVMKEERDAMQGQQVNETVETIKELEDKLREDISRMTVDEDGNAVEHNDEAMNAAEQLAMALPVRRQLAELRQMMKAKSAIQRDLDQTGSQAERQRLEREMDMMQRRITLTSREIKEELKDIIGQGRDRRAAQVKADIERQQQIVRMGCRAVRDKEVPDTMDKKNSETFWSRLSSKAGAARDMWQSPIFSFNFMAKYIDHNNALGDGEFYNYFMKGEHGALKANNEMSKGIRESGEAIEAKSQEIFGKSIDKVMAESAKVTNRKIYKLKADKSVPEEEWVQKDERMTKGQMLYAWLTWRQEAGRVKMQADGWTQRSIREMEDQLGPEMLDFGKWVTDEYLKQLRDDKYNVTYEKVMGTSMHKANHYFPLRIDKVGIADKSEVGQDGSINLLPSASSGNLIVRTTNRLPVDLSNDAFEVLQDYIITMERWNAMAELTKDLNTLIKSPAFRNLMEANHEGLFDRWKDACAVATASYHTKATDVDKFLSNLHNGFMQQAIGYGWYTAAKQTLSAPAFWAYSADPRYWKNMAWEGNVLRSYQNYQWAKENLPSFAERVAANDFGIEAINDKSFMDMVTRKFKQGGMAANKLVDAITVANGARAVYEYDRARFKKMLNEDGTRKYTDEQAEELARVNAQIVFNESQQSSRNEFSAPIQKQRGIMQRATVAFQNSNIGYRRMLVEGMEDLVRKDGDKMRGFAKVLNVAALNAFWYMGLNPALTWQMVSGNADDEQKDKFWDNIGLSVMLGYLANGTLLGPAMTAWTSEHPEYNPIQVYDALKTVWTDARKQYQKENWGAMSWAIMDYVMKAGGVNLEKFDGMYNGVVNALKRGELKADDIFSILNMARTQRREFAMNDAEGKTLTEYLDDVMRADKKVLTAEDRTRAWWGGDAYNKVIGEDKIKEITKEYLKRHNPESIPAMTAIDEMTKAVDAEMKVRKDADETMQGGTNAAKAKAALERVKVMDELYGEDPAKLKLLKLYEGQKLGERKLKLDDEGKPETNKKGKQKKTDPTYKTYLDKLHKLLNKQVVKMMQGDAEAQKKVDEIVAEILAVQDRLALNYKVME